MRTVKWIGATVLIGTSPAALACDLEAFGGAHRYFAFANMVGGASPDAGQPSAEAANSEAGPSEAPISAARATEPAEEPSTETADQSPDQPAQPSGQDGSPSDGAVFR